MPRPKAFHPDAALDRAMDLFWRKGFEGASLSALLQAMGISRQSLYNSFGNKRSLFLQVLDRYGEMKSLQLMLLEQDGAGLSAVQEYFNRLVASIEAQPEYGACLYTVAAVELGLQDLAVKSRVEEHDARLETALCGALEEASIQGEWSPSLQAARLLALSKGLGVLSRTGRPIAELKAMISAEMSLLGASP